MSSYTVSLHSSLYEGNSVRLAYEALGFKLILFTGLSYW